MEDAVSKPNILLVDRTLAPGMQVIDDLKLEVVDLTFMLHAAEAIKRVKKNSYDLIILGDKLKEGDTYDVGLELKTGKENRRTAVLCVGHHLGRANRLLHLLGNRALLGSAPGATLKIKAYLETEKK